MPRNPYTGVHNPYPYFPAAGRTGPFPDRREDTERPLPRYAGVFNAYHADNLEERHAAQRDAENTEPVTLADGTIVPTVWTDEDFTQATGIYMGETVTVPLPSGHRVEEVTLEVPVSHGKLTYALGAVDATIAGRRAFGYTIPEESRTVTTIGNEVVIRWEEHS